MFLIGTNIQTQTCFSTLHIGAPVSAIKSGDMHQVHTCPPTSSVFLAQVRKPPDITQAHGEAHLGKDVLQLVVPGRSTVLCVRVRGGYQGLYWSSRAGTQTHTHLAALVVHGVLQGQQVGHRLGDRLIAVLPLGHLGVLWHGCNPEAPSA